MSRGEGGRKAPRVLAIIPVYNEAQAIDAVVGSIPPPAVDEVLVVDDGSGDATPRILARHRVTVLRHERRRGVGAAIRTGLDYALGRGYDAVVIMAGNGKDDPREIGRLVRALWDGGCDYVQGSRFMNGGDYANTPRGRLTAVKGYSLLWSLRFGRRLTDVTNGFRAYRCSLFSNRKIDIWQDWLDGYELEYYLHYQVLAQRLKFAEVPVTKIYPGRPCTKIRPIVDWYRILRPFFLLTLGLKR